MSLLYCTILHSTGFLDKFGGKSSSAEKLKNFPSLLEQFLALCSNTNLHSKGEFSTVGAAACPCPGSLSDCSQGRDKPLPLRLHSLFADWYKN